MVAEISLVTVQHAISHYLEWCCSSKISSTYNMAKFVKYDLPETHMHIIIDSDQFENGHVPCHLYI